MTGFLSLPCEIRNIIYTYLLVQQKPVDPFLCYRPISPGIKILYANKAIYRESIWILYSQNCFDLSWRYYRAEKLLNIIGPENAGNIQSIRISFPSWPPGDSVTTLPDESACDLEKIENDCPRLKTLIMAAANEGRKAWAWLYKYHSPKTTTRAFSLINDRLTVFPSLEKIIVEVNKNKPSSDRRMEMNSLGWIVREELVRRI